MLTNNTELKYELEEFLNDNSVYIDSVDNMRAFLELMKILVFKTIKYETEIGGREQCSRKHLLFYL